MGFESDLWDHGPMQIAAYPSELHPSIAQALLSGGIATKLIDNPDTLRQPAEWTAVLVDATVDVERRIREASRLGQDTGIPVVVVIESTDLSAIRTASDIADFVLLPLNPEELGERLTRASSEPEPAVVLTHGDLVLNTATYQATLDGDPIESNVHGIRAVAILRRTPKPCLEPRTAPVGSLGIRLLWWLPNR